MAEYIEREAVLTEIENDYKNAEKIRTPFAHIIVSGAAEKPYYDILYLDTTDGCFHIGFGSYCLEYVRKWLEVAFEVIVDYAADVVERKRGEWGQPFKVDAENVGYACSVCGEFGVPCWNYCPNCGCDMRGEKA